MDRFERDFRVTLNFIENCFIVPTKAQVSSRIRGCRLLFSITASTLLIFMMLSSVDARCFAQSWVEEKPLNSASPFYRSSFESLTKLNCHSSVRSSLNTIPQIKLLKVIKTADYATGVAWSSDEKYFTVGAGLGSNQIEIRSFPTLKLISQISKTSHVGTGAISFLPNSDDFLVSTVAPYDGKNSDTYSLISALSGEVLKEVPGYSSPPRYPLANGPGITAFSADGKFLISTQNGAIGIFFVYDTNDWSLIGQFKQYGPLIPGPGKDQVSIIHSSQGAIHKELIDKAKPVFQELTVYDLDSYRSVLDYEIPAEYPFSAQLAAANWNSCILALGSIDTTGLNFMYKGRGLYAGLLGVSNGLKIIMFDSKKVFDLQAVEPIEQLAISQKARIVSFADGLNNIYLLFITPSDSFFAIRFSHFSTMVSDLTFSPDGKYIAIAGDEKVEIFSIGG